MMQVAKLILIADDDAELLELIGSALSEKGYRTETASNGEEALQLAAKTEPDLVLLDMRMPIMDGWTFARIFHERYGRRIPIVVITAAEDSSLRAAEVGANDALGKPFELARLYEVVEDTIGQP
jgi:CheY-like chemotaxis protein